MGAVSRGRRDTGATGAAGALWTRRDAKPDGRVIITAASGDGAAWAAQGLPASIRRSARGLTWLACLKRRRRDSRRPDALQAPLQRSRPPHTLRAIDTAFAGCIYRPNPRDSRALSKIRQFFTMRNNALRYKNSWCRAQIRCFAMPKIVPQYKTHVISPCLQSDIFLSKKRSTRTIGRGRRRRLCSMH
ncbi:TPA: hypothetical protein QDB44_000082 [Burkholderia vietnamiensis]|nr:hypothetical protein [Burkholderia vietnamiensis]